MRRAAILALLVGACGGDRKPAPGDPVAAAPPDAACPDLVYPRPAPEVAQGKVDVDLPAVPAFELPEMVAGEHSVRELEVDGARLFDTELAVRGYVAWVYDCFTTVRANPEWASWSDKAIRKEIEAHPDQYCRRPLFRITTATTDDPTYGLKVVNVPRLPTKAEKKLLPKEELADKTIWRPVPPLKVGDEVVVIGTWTQRSNIGETDTQGLLVYGSLTNVTQGWPKP